MTQQPMRQLLIFGALLFLFGLLNGAVIPSFTNPRMGLSAHLAGVQNGMVLLLFGLLWPYLTLSNSTLSATHGLSLYEDVRHLGWVVARRGLGNEPGDSDCWRGLQRLFVP